MKQANDHRSYIGVSIFDTKLELSCVREIEGIYMPKYEVVNLHRSEITHGLIYQRNAIARHIKQFICQFPDPWIILSIDDRLAKQDESLEPYTHFHFFLFIIKAQLNCLFFITHARASSAAQKQHSIITDEVAQRAVGIYLLGKMYDEKND